MSSFKLQNIKFTIITVCRNREAFLAETIESVINQTYKNIEYIVIDGASTDRTVDVIKSYEDKITKWISEPDGGMYDAINKGIGFSSGDYILILNSDDVLVNQDVIADVAHFISKSKLDYYYGNIVKFQNGNGKKVKLFNVTYNKLLLSQHGTFASHPTFFISADYNRKLGGYDLKYKYASDFDYILRALSDKDGKGRHMNIYITRFRIHDGSITASGKIENERQEILKTHRLYDKPALYRHLAFFSLWVYYKAINWRHRYKKV